jgi:hypothetical protein
MTTVGGPDKRGKKKLFDGYKKLRDYYLKCKEIK